MVDPALSRFGIRSGRRSLAHLAGEFDGGVLLIDKAVALNPNFAAGWFLGGFLHLWRGEHDDAIKRFERAMRLENTILRQGIEHTSDGIRPCDGLPLVVK